MKTKEINPRADFGALGARSAFPGRLATSWGAQMLARPELASLEEAALSKSVPLGQLASPRSGIATRVVNYFIVEEISDRSAQEEHGLLTRADRRRLALVRDGRGQTHLLERAALSPIVRRPATLEGNLRVDESATGNFKVLYLDADKDGLRQRRWRYTLDYIRYGETTDFPAGPTSRRAGGVPAQRNNVRTRAVWFQVPRMEDGPGRICWIKGRGSRHYVPVLDAGILVPDNFLYSAPPPNLLVPEVFAAIANLSWTHLMVEQYGRRGGGDGVLHTYKRELDMLPFIDPHLLTPTQAEDLVSLFQPLWDRPVGNIDDELREADRQAFDLWAMTYLFGSDGNTAAVAVERALRDLAEERAVRTASGRQQESTSRRRRAFDPVPVAARLLLDVGNPPNPASVVDVTQEEALDRIQVELLGQVAEPVTKGDSLFDSDAVLSGNAIIVRTPSSGHARLVASILQLAPTIGGPLSLPADEREADKLARTLEGQFREWASNMSEELRARVPGAGVARRSQVVVALEGLLSFPTGALEIVS